MFQGLWLFKGVRLFQTLEYPRDLNPACKYREALRQHLFYLICGLIFIYVLGFSVVGHSGSLVTGHSGGSLVGGHSGFLVVGHSGGSGSFWDGQPRLNLKKQQMIVIRTQ